jgi:hypothetical protein
MTFPSAPTRKLNCSFSRHLVLLVAIVFAPEMQAQGGKERSSKPVLYNFIAKEGDPIDQLIRERYSRKYGVVELRNASSYTEAKLTKTRFPNPVYDNENKEVSGSVRVCFVVTADGRLVDPFIYGSASPLLEGPVLEALREFRAVPARVKGASVASVETLRFTFGPAPRRRLDTGGA